MVRVFSWNVNGLRSAAKQGFLKWLSYEAPDILCLQEVKCQISDLEDVLITPFDYESYWASAEKRGYSGLAIYSKTKPVDVKVGLGIPYALPIHLAATTGAWMRHRYL